jgi:CelD/BcsL family acetyltransferase involved in cellulose biosynthesis
MAYLVKEETFQTLQDYYNDKDNNLFWPAPFAMPFWLQTWWEAFGEKSEVGAENGGYELFLRSIWVDGRLAGIAPLMRRGGDLRLLGSASVCDYLDLICVAGQEELFMQTLLAFLREDGVTKFELEAQRPDALFFMEFYAALAGDPEKTNDLNFCHFLIEREDESFEAGLPADWESYLASLSKKQRHEVRRKLRRLLDETIGYYYRSFEDSAEIETFMPQFFELFLQNPEKQDFLTDQMEHFFRSLISAAARAGIARFGLLEIDGIVAAAILFFDFNGRIWLYNSGYLPEYSDLSAGLISKILCLKESIENGRQVFDFMKGQEVYKSRLGGKGIPIYKVTITFPV